MRILYSFLILLFICNLSYAKRLDEMNANTSPDITNDLIYSQDVSDTSEASTGTGKSLTIKNLLRAGNITVDGVNVGISTTTPQQKLQVVGTVSATSFIGDGSGLTGVAASASDAAYSSSWNGDTTGIASKNALYDKIETISSGGSGINWDSYDALSSLSNGYQFLINASGTNKDINWENIQQISGFDASVTYNVKQYGAKGDGTRWEDGAITSGTDDFTSASATFTSADVGKVITIRDAGGTNIDLTSTISAFVNSTSVTLADNASATVSGVPFTYGTDDTNAIRAAMAAIGTNSVNGVSAILFFPAGTYIVNGAFDQSKTSQIAFPINAFANPQTTVTIKGSSSSGPNGDNNSGSIIFGTRNGTLGTQAILSVTDSGGVGTGNVNRTNAVFENIRFRTVQDPYHTAVNLEDVDQAQGLNVIFDTTADGSALPTHSGSYALKMPDMLDGNVSGGWKNLKIKLYYNGVRMGEHSLIWSAFIVFGVNAIHFYDCRYPAQVFQVAVESVQNSVLVSSSGSTTSYFKIYDLDLEHNSGTFANATNLIDSSNLGVGEIHYSIFDNGGGSTFTKSGGKNVSLHNIKTNQMEYHPVSGDHFSIVSSAADSSTSGGSLLLKQNDYTALDSGSRLGLIGFAGSYSTTGTQYIYGAAIQALSAEAFTASAAGTHLQFRTAPTGSTTALERVRITSEGNIGIGTTTPTQALHVVGNARITGLTSGECVQASTGGLLTTTGSACGAGGGSGTVNSGGADFVAIYDSAGTAVSASSLLSDNGTNIGIGTVGPVSKLQVNGTITATAFSGDGSALTGIGSGGWTDGGTNVYVSPTTDNVGIGTTTPNATLLIENVGTGNSFRVNDSASDSSPLVVTSNGNVGIGTLLPGVAFQVSGGLWLGPGANTDTLKISNSNGMTYQYVGNYETANRTFHNFSTYNHGGESGNQTTGLKSTTSSYQTGSGSFVRAIHGEATTVNPSGTTDNVYGVYGNTVRNGAGGTVTNSYGIYGASGTVTAGTVTNNFALGASGRSVFSGNVGIGSALTDPYVLIAPGTGGLNVSGNVGVGTWYPQQKLQVVGTISATSFVGDGSALTGVGSSGWVDGGTNIYASPTTDNVAIGTTTPTQKLTVVGTVSATAFVGDGSGLTGLPSGGGWSDGGTNVYTSTTTDTVGIGTTTPSTTLEIVKQGSSAPLMVSSTATGDGNILIITSAGNVGIGTLLPRGPLDLGPTGTIYAQTIAGPTGPTILGTSNNVGIGTITAGSLLTVGSTGQVTVSSAGAVTTSSTVSVADDAYAAGWNGSTAVPTKNAVYDKIETLGSGGWTDGGTNVYTTTTSDNVGIGTTSPGRSLQIYGSPEDSLVGISLYHAGTGGRDWVIGSSDNTNTIGGGKFSIFDNTSFEHRFTINSNGNVGIGSTSPNASLDIRNTTSSIGWTVQTAANQACNTTCTSGCVYGQDTGTSNGPIVNCSDASADRCLCAGSN